MLSLLALFSLKGLAIGVLTVIHVIICFMLIAIVLLQQKGRGADLASAFGAGPTQTNVAALSSEDMLTKGTRWGAFAFMGTSLILALHPPGEQSLAIDTVPPPAATAPASVDETATPAEGASESTLPTTEPAPAEPAPAAPPTP